MAVGIIGGPLLAQVFDQRILITGALLAGALLLGAFVIACIRRVLRSPRASVDPVDELTRYRQLYERGELSEEEFKRLRGLLGGEVRRQVGLETNKPAPEVKNAIQSPGSPGRPPEGPPPGSGPTG